MIFIDIFLGFLAGIVSCLTPEALLLFPLLIAAAGAGRRGGVVAIAVGLGLSLVLTGAGALGFDAVWLRRVVCVVLLLQGAALMSTSTVERFPWLTGGLSGSFEMPGAPSSRGAFRLLLLAIFVGANWIPLIGPTLGKASLMAADARNSGQALGMLFAFGFGAALPWIAVGQIARFLLRPVAARAIDGMAGKRILGASLLIVAIIGGAGWDVAMTHTMDKFLPSWALKLATTF